MKTITMLAAAAAVAALASAANAKDTELGSLGCTMDGGVEFTIASTKDVRCTYTPHRGTPESYAGTIRKVGVNVGVTGAKIMQWIVIQRGSDAYQPGSLAGDYAGISGEATVAIGAGANILGGGSNSSFLLQPVSIQEQAGLNFAAGVTRFSLSPN